MSIVASTPLWLTNSVQDLQGLKQTIFGGKRKEVIAVKKFVPPHKALVCVQSRKPCICFSLRLQLSNRRHFRFSALVAACCWRENFWTARWNGTLKKVATKPLNSLLPGPGPSRNTNSRPNCDLCLFLKSPPPTRLKYIWQIASWLLMLCCLKRHTYTGPKGLRL